MIDAAEEMNHSPGNKEVEAGGKINNRPPAPDEKTEPVAFLRWQMIHQLRFDESTVEGHCQRFQQQIDQGEVVFDEEQQKWIRPDVV